MRDAEPNASEWLAEVGEYPPQQPIGHRTPKCRWAVGTGPGAPSPFQPDAPEVVLK
jgi:hypothetical protein